jgi:hypothetical protein
VSEICFDEGSLPKDLTGVAIAYSARTPERQSQIAVLISRDPPFEPYCGLWPNKS